MVVMDAVDIFSDVSQKAGGPWCGAYVIGLGGEAVGIKLQSDRSTDAECEAMLKSAREAIGRGHTSLTLHTDLVDVRHIMKRANSGPAYWLARLIESKAIDVRTDAKKFKEHGKCHSASRSYAGIKKPRKKRKVSVTRLAHIAQETVPTEQQQSQPKPSTRRMGQMPSLPTIARRSHRHQAV